MERTMIRREKRYVEQLDRRLDHLEERAEEDPSLTWDRAEASAIRFALAVVAGAERMGLLDLVHEEGKATMRGPNRLAWLKDAPETDVPLHLEAPGSEEQIRAIRQAARRLQEAADRATWVVAPEDEEMVMGAFDSEEDILGPSDGEDDV